MEENLEEILQISDLCRLCATKPSQLVPIFKGEGLQHDLALKIRTHLPIQVSESDTLPLHLCYDCTSTIIHWDVMVVDCVAADRKLRALQWRVQCLEDQGQDVSGNQEKNSRTPVGSGESLSCSLCSYSGMDFRQLVRHLRNHKTTSPTKRKLSPMQGTVAKSRKIGKVHSMPELSPQQQENPTSENGRVPLVCLERVDSKMKLRPINKRQSRKQTANQSTDFTPEEMPVLEDPLGCEESMDVDISVSSSCEPEVTTSAVNCSLSQLSENQKTDSRDVSTDPVAALSPAESPSSPPDGEQSLRSRLRRRRSRRTVVKKGQQTRRGSLAGSDDIEEKSNSSVMESELPNKLVKPTTSTPMQQSLLKSSEKPRVRIVSAESINQSLEQRAIMSQKIPILPKPLSSEPRSHILTKPIHPDSSVTMLNANVPKGKNNSVIIPAHVVKQIRNSPGPQLVQLPNGRIIRFSGTPMLANSNVMSISGKPVDSQQGNTARVSGIYALPGKPVQGSTNASSGVSVPTVRVSLPSTQSATSGNVRVLPDGRKVLVMPKGVRPTILKPWKPPAPKSPPSPCVSPTISGPIQQPSPENMVIKVEPDDILPASDGESLSPPDESSPPKKMIILFRKQPGPKNGAQRYICTHCGKTNLLKEVLSLHAETHQTKSSQNNFQVSLLKKPVNSSSGENESETILPTSGPELVTSPTFTCRHCDENFKSPDGVKLHLSFCLKRPQT